MKWVFVLFYKHIPVDISYKSNDNKLLKRQTNNRVYIILYIYIYSFLARAMNKELNRIEG